MDILADNNNEVNLKIDEIISKSLWIDRSEIIDELSFIHSGADSLSFLNFILELENNFNIYIPDDEAEKIRTVGDAKRIVWQKLHLA